MSRIRVALSLTGVAYALFGLVVVLFAANLRQPVDIGTAYLAVGILAWGVYLLAILSGWIGALVLGWFAWEFWTHSSHPKVAA